jgi:hypothetical protein
MSEYTSIRTSSWDVDAMVTKLNEHAKQGWSLVSVVNTGADLAAILTRGGASPDSSASSAATASSVATAAEVVAARVTPEPVVVEATPVEVVPVAATPAATPVAEPAGWGSAVEAAAEVAPMVIEPMPSNDNSSSSASAAVEAAVTPIETVAAAAVTSTPAGWYPDPSGRFEMRYWDGSAWTEHVARGGQQYTDPPIA